LLKFVASPCGGPLQAEDTRRLALAALAKIEAEGTHVTVSALAEAAGVARSWIYTSPT
jgi:hypothetical protein